MSRVVRQYLINSVSGVANQFSTMLVGAVLMPFLISRLGQESYGMYQIAIAAIGFFSFLNMGIAPSLIRYFSGAINSSDYIGLTKTSTTGIVLLGSLGFLGMLAIILLIPFGLQMYAVPDEIHAEANGFTFSSEADLQSLDAVIIAVAHRQFKELGAEKITSMVKTSGVIADLKGLFRKDDFPGAAYWRL